MHTSIPHLLLDDTQKRLATALIADILFAVVIGSFEATIPLHT
jgi:hypothetical protein